MTDAPTLQRLRIAYQLEGGEPEVVTVHNKSLIAFDETRGKRKWPTPGEAPSLWSTFLVWHTLRARGDEITYEQFRDRCEAIEVQEEPEDVDPTPPETTDVS